MTAVISAPAAPEWTLCPGCHSMLCAKVLSRPLQVCPQCGRHGWLSALERLAHLADDGSLRELDFPVTDADTLGFVDRKPYPRRRDEARAATGLREAMLCARLTIKGQSLVAAVMDFGFLGGSLGRAVGDLLAQAARCAVADRVPLAVVTASGGAHMQKGTVALVQMARTAMAVRSVQDAGLLTVCLITDPTYGGAAASFATLRQVIVAEPGARLGFAGPRVVAQTIGERLPDGFQSAEFLLERDFIDAIYPRDELRDLLGRLLRAVAPAVRGDVVADGAAPTRPNIDDYLYLTVDDFQKLRSDRLGGDCPPVVGEIGRWAGRPVMVIGHRKGHTGAEMVRRNYGMAGPDGYRKAGRLMRLAGRLGIPVVTLVDTSGAYPDISAEKNGQAFAIAENLALMGSLPVLIIAVVTGEGGSGGALALAVAGRVLMLADAVYSVISPEGRAAILWAGGENATATAAASLRADARSLLALRIVNGVIPVPPGGPGDDPDEPARRLRTSVTHHLDELCDTPRTSCRPAVGRGSTPCQRRDSTHERLAPRAAPGPGRRARCRSDHRAQAGGTAGPPQSLHVQRGDTSVRLEWPSATAQGAAPPTGAAMATATTPATVMPAKEFVQAPILGTFYRPAEPGAGPYLKEGQTVSAGQQVGVIEAMKLLVPVEAPRSGRIAAVLVKDAEPVQYGEALFALAPGDE
ncbi:carboxyl transferase domain-containing protein [Micromonospora sp. PTRAS2]